MPLTKSLHTITAVTNVAKRELHHQPSVVSPETLAGYALFILGYNNDTTIKGDPTVDKIVENCRVLISNRIKEAA